MLAKQTEVLDGVTFSQSEVNTRDRWLDDHERAISIHPEYSSLQRTLELVSTGTR